MIVGDYCASPVLPVGRRALLVRLAAALVFAPATARADMDLLKIPALMSAKAAQVLLLGIARAGRRSVAVGERGIIVWSDDDGATWQQAAVPVSVTLTAVHFPTPTVGWAVGHDGVVLHSTDAGLSWTQRFDGTTANALVLAEAQAGLAAAIDPAARAAAESAVEDAQAGAEFGPSRPLLCVWFRTPEVGFVVGSYGQIFRTDDGGRSWVSLSGALANPEGLHYNIITATPSGALLIAGEGGRVYRSQDGGATWETLETGSASHLFGIQMLPDGALLAFGFGGRVFRSDDGVQWRAVATPTQRTLIGAAALGDGLVLIDGAGGSILSTDAGISFRALRPPSTRAVTAILATGDGKNLIQIGMGGARVVPLAG